MKLLIKSMIFLIALTCLSVYSMQIEKETEIDKLGWLCVEQKKMLVARSIGSDKFYIPGGKREGQESDHEALMREIKEELSIDLEPSSINYFDAFKSQAHGKKHGVQVKITCYEAKFSGAIAANSEIEEVAWFGYEDKEKCSLATQVIIEHLRSLGKI